MIYGSAPTSTYTRISEASITGFLETEITTGKLITNNKIVLSNVVSQQGGSVRLQEFSLYQQDTSALGDLEKTDIDLYVFKNEDALGALVSGSDFILDATNTADMVCFHHKFVAADWVDLDANNTKLQLKGIDKLCPVALAAQQSLAFCLVARASNTFATHTLKYFFGFDQVTV